MLNDKIYHTRPKAWNFDRAKAPGLNDRKAINIKNMDRLTIIQPRELSRRTKSKFLAECGIKACWKRIGPGFITGVSDDDPSGIATYSQAGAAFGLNFLWTALLTYPLMYYIQEMSARIGIVASTGLMGVVSKHYGPFFVLTVFLLVIPAIIFNIAADLASMGAILHAHVPSLSPFIWTLFVVLFSLSYMFFCRYKTIANVFKFSCFSLFCYFIVPFLVKQDWQSVFYSTFIPQIEWSKDYVFLLVAILGTTLSPYLFFWQSSMSSEEKKQKDNQKKTEIKWMKHDVNFGMFLSNLAMYFIILTGASVLHVNGVVNINTVEEAALALEPLAGKSAFIVFSIGILGIGFLAIPVLAGCIGYMVAEYRQQRASLDQLPHQNPVLYVTITLSMILGLGINFLGIPPFRSLIWAAALYGIATPPLIALILHVCNNKAIMGKYVNTPVMNLIGWMTFFLMSSAALALLVLMLL